MKTIVKGQKISKGIFRHATSPKDRLHFRVNFVVNFAFIFGRSDSMKKNLTFSLKNSFREMTKG